MKRIATTTSDDLVYADYLDYCEANGNEAKGEDSPEFYEWQAETAALYWESDMEFIREYPAYNVPVVIRGTLGLWDGRHTIEPVEQDSVYAAIQRCFGHSIQDMDVFWFSGTIVVHAHHHDGTNIFEISAKSREELPFLYE